MFSSQHRLQEVNDVSSLSTSSYVIAMRVDICRQIQRARVCAMRVRPDLFYAGGAAVSAYRVPIKK